MPSRNQDNQLLFWLQETGASLAKQLDVPGNQKFFKSVFKWSVPTNRYLELYQMVPDGTGLIFGKAESNMGDSNKKSEDISKG
ncbi:MAG: hypothetical protein HQM13_19975 [SAR324 cluster bacterium]|nr:hypothetical protein [SAR324 cluster bacterium]